MNNIASMVKPCSSLFGCNAARRVEEYENGVGSGANGMDVSTEVCFPCKMLVDVNDVLRRRTCAERLLDWVEVRGIRRQVQKHYPYPEDQI